MKLLFAILLMFPMLPATARADALGDWVTADKSVVNLYHCGDKVCGKLVHVSGNYVVDDKNPNAALRKRPLCGLDIATGFKVADAEHISDGQLYDPESGKTYSGTMTLQGDVLKLRGYVGIPLFGRTETWRRSVSPPAVCAK